MIAKVPLEWKLDQEGARDLAVHCGSFGEKFSAIRLDRPRLAGMKSKLWAGMRKKSEDAK